MILRLRHFRSRFCIYKKILFMYIFYVLLEITSKSIVAARMRVGKIPIFKNVTRRKGGKTD